MQQSVWAMPPDVAAVHSEIEEWRSKRTKRTAIPSEIWSSAVELAGRYNVYRISQALRLNYQALKRRLAESSSKPGTLSARNSESDSGCEFVELSGVGMKVADCVCLYSLGFMQSFPNDVWMSRVLCGAYGYTGKNDKALRSFIDEKFGGNAGIAQQYLFHYARHNPQMVCKV